MRNQESQPLEPERPQKEPAPEEKSLDQMTPEKKLEALGVPQRVFPDEVYEDEEMLNFLADQMKGIKSEVSMGALTGHDEVRDELRGVQKDTGASKILFKAMDRAVYLKKPELARRIAETAGFDMEDVRSDIWNQFMMTRIHSLGWEYFFKVGKEFDFEKKKMLNVLQNSLERNLQRGKYEALKVYFEHKKPDQEISDNLIVSGMQGLTVLYSDKKYKEAGELSKLLNFSEDQRRSAQEQSVSSLIRVSKFDDAISLAAHVGVDAEFLSEKFKQRYLAELKRLHWNEIGVLETSFSEYLKDVSESKKNEELISGLVSKMNQGAQQLLTEENRSKIEQLPSDVLRAEALQRQAADTWIKLVLDSDQKADEIAELFQLSDEMRDAFSRRVIEQSLTKATLGKKTLDNIIILIKRQPRLRQGVAEVGMQQKIVEAIKQLRGSKKSYLDLLNAEYKRQIYLDDIESALTSNNKRQFIQISRDLGLFNGVEIERRWDDIKTAFERGFSIQELDKYPFLISSLINK